MFNIHLIVNVLIVLMHSSFTFLTLYLGKSGRTTLRPCCAVNRDPVMYIIVKLSYLQLLQGNGKTVCTVFLCIHWLTGFTKVEDSSFVASHIVLFLFLWRLRQFYSFRSIFLSAHCVEPQSGLWYIYSFGCSCVRPTRMLKSLFYRLCIVCSVYVCVCV